MRGITEFTFSGLFVRICSFKYCILVIKVEGFVFSSGLCHYTQGNGAAVCLAYSNRKTKCQNS